MIQILNDENVDLSLLYNKIDVKHNFDKDYLFVLINYISAELNIH